MGSYTTLKNTSILIDLFDDYKVTGWTISNGIAYHDGCDAGVIRFVMNLSSQTEWTFRYTIGQVFSGGINIIVNGVAGITRTEPGTYGETFTVNGANTLIQFYSNGKNSVEVLETYPVLEVANGTTLAFNEGVDKWVTYYSYLPEFMCKFLTNFFTFRSGVPWEHNVNETRNNFYGVQYNSEITFYCNMSPTELKNFHSMRQKSNQPWAVIDAEIPPRYGKPNGQKSRLKKGRFKSLQGDWFSDFLRDLSDPRFTTELDALMGGAELQGNIMKITIQNTDTTEVRLLSVDLVVSLSQYTY